MKSITLTWTTAITLFAALALPVRVPAQGHTRYQVIDLGTLGGKRSNIGGINNRGEVVGGSTLLSKEDSNFHAFLWNNGAMNDLGTLGGPSSTANAVSSSTQVVGVAETTNSGGNPDFCFLAKPASETRQCRAFLWRNGAMNDLGTLGGTNSAVPTKGINSRGQVVGIAETPTQEFHAFLWQNGVMTDLRTLGGPAVALGINDLGQVVGAASFDTDSNLHAFLWENGLMSDLGTLGGKISFALVNNNKGQVVGLSALPGDEKNHAFLWKDGNTPPMIDLTPLSLFDANSAAFDISDKGQVVGELSDLGGRRAFLWENGVMTDLNTLISADDSLYLLSAFQINDRGQIVGDALQKSTGEVHAFLATPSNGGVASESVTSAAIRETSQSSKVVLPENVRKMLRDRLGHRYRIPGFVTGPTD
jgi:probable HAF family extracellular repeat protein